MGLNWVFRGGETPLDPDEIEGLRVPLITTRAELDEHEQLNIQRANAWLLERRPSMGDLLTDTFVKRLHREMFGEVWQWAGAFRRTEKNLGVDPLRIARDLRQLLDDVRFWVEHDTLPPDEIAIGAKHRMVSIHCFVNGNGRHARLFADVLAQALGRPPFSWGTSIPDREVRQRYLEALRQADRGDLQPLLAFACS